MFEASQLVRQYVRRLAIDAVVFVSLICYHIWYTILPALKIGVFFNILCRFASAAQPICQGPHMYPFI